MSESAASGDDFVDALAKGWAEAIDREDDLRRRRSTMPEPRDQDRELDVLIDRLERLNDPEARYERGEDSTRAELAALADKHLLSLAQEVRRLRLVLYPRVVA